MPYKSIGGFFVWAPSKPNSSNKRRYKKSSNKEFGRKGDEALKNGNEKYKSEDNFGKSPIEAQGDNEWRIVCSTKDEFEKYVRIKGVSSSKSTRLPTHPLENGMVRHDHKIIEPRQINVDCYVELSIINANVPEQEKYTSRKFANMLDELIAEKSLDTYITVYNPMEKFPDKMYLLSYKNTTENDKTDVFRFTLTLQEILKAQSESKISQNAAYAGTSAKGGLGQGTKA